MNETESPRHHRWVTQEPHIPFDVEVIYEDANIIVIDKPHFLSTTPRGMWYRETALMRVRERYGEPQIIPAHRLDRPTAGIVVFVRNPNMRGAYQMLFQRHEVDKTYECLAPATPMAVPRFGTVTRLSGPSVFPLLRRSRIVKDRGRLQAYEEPGLVNAETEIEVAGRLSAAGSTDPGRCVGRGMRAYALHPATGKTHQLRVHMSGLGWPIMGDDFYPIVRQRGYDDFSSPLQLVARSLRFNDPVSGEPRRFVSRIALGDHA